MLKSLVTKIGISSTLCLILGTTSGLLTVTGVNSWYTTINKPWWNPPNWIFGPVWTILYLLMGASFAIAWHKGGQVGRKMMLLFVVQFLLNLVWSPTFFYFHNITLAFLIIALMWVIILLTIFAAGKVKPVAAWLLVPYISWVSFAMILNGTIMLMN
ncbi:MAG: TspO/MBR family protein [Sphingobacteriales bacterium]